MKNFNQIVERVIENFINSKVEGTKDIAPRPGFYFIKSVAFETVKPFGEILFAKVNWKQHEPNYFFENVDHKIALSNLYSANPSETISLEKEDLVGKVIQIYNPIFGTKNFNGIAQKVLKCQWRFVDVPAKFINEQNLALICISQHAKNGKDFYQNLLDTAPYDVLEALDWESSYGHKDDMQIEGWADQYDIVEEPFDNDAYDSSEDGNTENGDSNDPTSNM